MAEVNRDPTYTVVCCHFGDPFWVTHTLERLEALGDERIASVVVVDQSRSSDAVLRPLPRVDDVLTFPVDAAQVAGIGHDHPATLNRAMATIDFATSHVLVLDSDCFPVGPDWLDRLDDVTLAADPFKWGLSHPCLMAFPVAVAPRVDFGEGLAEVGLDTGRLVALQLVRMGLEVHLDQPAGRGFGGQRGYFYLGGAVYHHGSASFAASADDRLARQVSPPLEAMYRRRIAAGDLDSPI